MAHDYPKKRTHVIVVVCKRCKTFCRENEGYDFMVELEPGLFEAYDDPESGFDTSGLMCECEEPPYCSGEEWVILNLTDGKVYGDL